MMQFLQEQDQRRAFLAGETPPESTNNQETNQRTKQAEGKADGDKVQMPSKFFLCPHDDRMVMLIIE